MAVRQQYWAIPTSGIARVPATVQTLPWSYALPRFWCVNRSSAVYGALVYISHMTAEAALAAVGAEVVAYSDEGGPYRVHVTQDWAGELGWLIEDVRV
jgi:hypothetical protein